MSFSAETQKRRPVFLIMTTLIILIVGGIALLIGGSDGTPANELPKSTVNLTAQITATATTAATDCDTCEECDNQDCEDTTQLESQITKLKADLDSCTPQLDTLRAVYHDCAEKNEDLTVQLQTGVKSDMFGSDDIGNNDNKKFKYEGKYNPYSFLSRKAVDEETGYCSWQNLSNNLKGRWVPRDEVVDYRKCNHIGSRYNCAFDENRNFNHTHKWILHSDKACKVEDSLTPKTLVAKSNNTRYRILMHGDSHMRELFETMMCEFKKEETYYKSFSDHGKMGDDFAEAAWGDNFSVVYDYRDYDATNLMLVSKRQGWGFKNWRSDNPQDFNILVTNYEVEMVEALLAKTYKWKNVAMVYITHTCARSGYVGRQGRYVEDVKSLGRPILDLCTMTQLKLYDAQAKYLGDAYDSHLCIPGPHLDLLNYMMHMLLSFGHQKPTF
jgi:hypothetical protein